jgi:hypothetical protein
MPSAEPRSRPGRGRPPAVLLAGALLLLATAALPGQSRLPDGLPPRAPSSWSDPQLHNAPYDGRFTFARLRFVTAPGGYYYGGLPAWAHGYPRAERNLMHIVNEISILHPHVDETDVFALDDPELDRYPVAYMTEAGFWTMTDTDASAFRAYLQKGGFVIFDDFRDDEFRGGRGWAGFESNMKRIIPDARFVDLDPSHPIFHAFFEIDSFDIIPQDYDRGRPVLRGLFEDNDPRKRLMAIANFNTDVSNYWEFSGTGVSPVADSNEAYKLGVNYIVYGMTH